MALIIDIKRKHVDGCIAIYEYFVEGTARGCVSLNIESGEVILLETTEGVNSQQHFYRVAHKLKKALGQDNLSESLTWAS